MNPIIIPATDHHAVQLAARLRAEDAAELRIGARRAALDVIRYSIAHSFSAWTWLVGDEPACIFGVGGNVIGTAAQPWLLTTDLVPQHAKTFWKHSRAIVAAMEAAHPNLAGFCDARYSRSLAWLARLGFRIDGPVPYGDFGAPFYRFSKGQ